MCRFRPLNQSEKERGDEFLPKFPSSEQVTFGHPVSSNIFYYYNCQIFHVTINVIVFIIYFLDFSFVIDFP